jgi:hypothetical protein
MDLIRIGGFALIGFAALVETTLAGAPAAPAPIAGIGLPALVFVAGAYWVGRRLFGGKK